MIIPGLKSARKVALNTPYHLGPRLKKEKIYISIPFWAFVSCSMVEFSFYVGKRRGFGDWDTHF